MTKYDLTHARHDPAHCMVPGLFRPLKKGERKTAKLDITYQFGEDEFLEFSGPEPLGAEDMRVLQGLVAMAGPSGIILHPEPKTEAGKQLRLSLETKWEATQEDALVVKGSFYQLMKEIGYNPNSGSKIKQLQKTIERLWKVSIIAQKGKQRRGFHLLSEYASDEYKGKIFIALNPRITKAILGSADNTGVAYILMKEVRELKSDVARILHQYLSAWIGFGKNQRCGIDKLIKRVWPNPPTSQSAIRKQRMKIRKAISEINNLKNWIITEERQEMFFIERKSHPKIPS